jgi:hypothetical protein
MSGFSTGVFLRLLLPTILAAALVSFSCGGELKTPELQVRSLIERAEIAAEDRDLSSLKKMISEGYSDELGNDRQAVLGMVRYHFLRNDAIHLLTRIARISFPTSSTADVTVFAAMAGEPIPSPTELAVIRADLYRFDFSLEGGGREPWRLVRASWRRAKPADFI